MKVYVFQYYLDNLKSKIIMSKLLYINLYLYAIRLLLLIKTQINRNILEYFNIFCFEYNIAQKGMVFKNETAISSM